MLALLFLTQCSIMSDFLDTTSYCPDAPQRLHHRDVAPGKRCKYCGLKRPMTSSLALRRRPSSDLEDDIIEISSTEPTPGRPSQPPPFQPATHLPKQKTSVGIVDTARRSAFTPKAEANYPSTIYFKITLARPSPSPSGPWETFPRAFAISETNRKVSYAEFHNSLWSKVTANLERPSESKWMTPDGAGDWVLVYGASGIAKTPPTPIEKWPEADFLFRRMREDGRFNKKPTGNTHEVSIAFVWMAETPVPIKHETEPDTPQKLVKKTSSKRLRAPDSPEAKRITTRRRALEVKAEKKEVHMPDDVEEDDDDDLPGVMTLIKGEASNAGPKAK